MNNEVMFSSKTDEWETPIDLFEVLNREFLFTLDPCCTHKNAKCEKHYTRCEDGLSQSWQGETVFCNPPYGREQSKWIQKAFAEWQLGKCKIVMLIPARTDTVAFHKFIYGIAKVRFIKGRLKFGGYETSAPFPSMIVIYD